MEESCTDSNGDKWEIYKDKDKKKNGAGVALRRTATSSARLRKVMSTNLTASRMRNATE